MFVSSFTYNGHLIQAITTEVLQNAFIFVVKWYCGTKLMLAEPYKPIEVGEAVLLLQSRLSVKMLLKSLANSMPRTTRSSEEWISK